MMKGYLDRAFCAGFAYVMKGEEYLPGCDHHCRGRKCNVRAHTYECHIKLYRRRIMSGSCCDDSAKPELVKTAAPETTETGTEQLGATTQKSECCSDKPAKREKHCGCNC